MSMETDGVSYWRRDQQTLGQLWCQQHHQPLRYVEDQSAYLSSPIEYLSEARSVPVSIVRSAQSNPSVKKFLEIVSGLMERTFPLDVKHVALALREKASERNLQTCGGKVRHPLLSDLVKHSFPNQWLNTVFSGISEKPDGQLLNHIDGVLYMRNSASSVSSYILAASVLYGTADKALNGLIKASLTHAEPTGRRERLPILDQTKELILAYETCQGDFKKVAQHTRRPVHQVKSLLLSIGLPNLSSRNRYQNKLAALNAFRLEGRSSSESAEIGGLTLEAMEDLNRNSGPELTKVLMKMKRLEKPLNGGKKFAALPWSLNEQEKQQTDVPQILETELQN